MQTKISGRVLASISFAACLLGCSPAADNPYAKIQDPPLLKARLHTATLSCPDAALPEKLEGNGYSYTPLPSNYPAAVTIESMLWKVPEGHAANAIIMMSHGKDPNLRLLVAPALPAAAQVDSEIEQAFYRNVLGVDVPRLPELVDLKYGGRVQVWTYLVDDIVVARRKLRGAGIPVTFEPVAITTSYLGDHRTMAIQAPDNTVIELVQNAAQ